MGPESSSKRERVVFAFAFEEGQTGIGHRPSDFKVARVEGVVRQLDLNRHRRTRRRRFRLNRQIGQIGSCCVFPSPPQTDRKEPLFHLSFVGAFVADEKQPFGIPVAKPVCEMLSF